MTALIGLLGRKRAGKDSAASFLVADGWQQVAFAEPLKQVAYDLNPYVITTVGLSLGTPPRRLADIVDERGWESAKEIPEVRRTLQRLGDSFRIRLEPDVLVYPAVRKILDGKWPTVVTDVRRENEAAAIRDLGGKLWRITRPGIDDSDTHISETALDDWPVDLVINNRGSLDDLRYSVQFAAEGLVAA